MYIDRKILIIEKLFGEWVYVSITHFTKLFLINSSNYIDLWSTKNSRKWRICKKRKRRKKMKNKVVSFDASFSRKSSLKNFGYTCTHNEYRSKRVRSGLLTKYRWLLLQTRFSRKRDFKILLYIFDIYFYKIIFCPVSYDPYSIIPPILLFVLRYFFR